jgi:DNA-binding response OmpR family regulator
MSKLLLVEDDLNFARSLISVLDDGRIAVDHATSAEAAADFLKSFRYDVLLLDWELPGMSGPQFCQILKQDKELNLPVLMLTGRDGTSNIIQGLDCGADDYLAKPCNTDELLARIRALLRRTGSETREVLQHGELKLFEEKHQVEFSGHEVKLSAREFELLRFFMMHPDTHFTSEAIFIRVWSSRQDLSHELVRMYVKKLRDKLAAIKGVSPIVTAVGSGYALISKLCTAEHEK